MMNESYTISAYGGWNIKESEGEPKTFSVYKYDERYTFNTYRSAYFIQNLFNDQDNWKMFKDGNTVTLSSDSQAYVIQSFPEANVRLHFGSEDTNTFIQFYCAKIPNRFQRWLSGKLFGIIITPLKN